MHKSLTKLSFDENISFLEPHTNTSPHLHRSELQFYTEVQNIRFQSAPAICRLAAKV